MFPIIPLVLVTFSFTLGKTIVSDELIGTVGNNLMTM